MSTEIAEAQVAIVPAVQSEQSELCADAARIVAVRNDAELADANETLSALKRAKSRFMEIFEPNKKRWNDGHKAACAQQNAFVKPIEAQEARIRPLVGAYEGERRRKQEAEHAAAVALARKEQEEKALAEAEELEAVGMQQEAAVVIAAAVATPRVSIPATPPPVAGGGGRWKWRAKVVDFAALPDEFKLANERKLQFEADDRKEKASVPGVVFDKEFIPSVRG